MRILPAIILIAAIFTNGTAFAEDRWNCYTRDGIVNDIAVAGPYLWCAAEASVMRWDTRDNSWIRYTCADGLPAGVLWKNIARDGGGRIWVFAADPAVAMIFDGTTWSAPDTTCWMANIRYPMAADGKGGTWTYYEGSGVVWFSGDEHRIHTSADGLAGSVVTALAIDSLDGVCVGMPTGLSHFNGEEWRSCNGADAPPGTDVRSMAIDPGGIAWVVTEKGVFELDGTTWMLRASEGDFRQIVIGPDGKKWFATDTGGLKRFDGVSWTSYTTANSGIPDDYVRNIAIDGSGVLWLSCGSSTVNTAGFGLTRFNGYSWTNMDTDGPLYNSSRCLAVDHDNVKWFGTDIGVSRYDGVKWSSYQRIEGRSITGIQTVIVDKTNRKWFMGREVISFDGAEWTFHTSENTPSQLLDMTSYAEDRNGVEWIGTTSTGIWRRDDGGEWRNYTPADGLPGGCVRAITVDRENTVWVGTDQGAAFIDGGVITRCAGGPESLVASISVDSRNVKWMGTQTGGLWRYDGFVWRNYTRENSGLADNFVSKVVADRDDVKWCIVSGFKRVQRLSGSDLEVWDMPGMDTVQVEAIAADSDNVKWFSTWGSGVMSLKTGTAPSTEVTSDEPSRFKLSGAYPNPFNGSTVIRFTLDSRSFTEVSIYSITGQRVRNLLRESLPPGEHTVLWDGRDDRGARAASGVYTARITGNRQRLSVKMMLIK